MRFKMLAASLWMSVCFCHTDASAQADDKPVKIIFDTDIESDVDDVGAVVVLHALANRGEAEILAMGISASHEWSPACLDALNTFYQRPDIPIGVLKTQGASENKSKYAQTIANEFPHSMKPGDTLPGAPQLYRKILASQPDRSVVMVSVGFLTNFAALLKTPADGHSPLNGVDLVRQKVSTWVCMGAQHPKGREWNVFKDAASSIHAIENWPTPIIFSGFEIGAAVKTGAGLKALTKDSPVRRAYELYNGLTDRQSWDQTAVLYAVRGLRGKLTDLWDIGTGGCMQIHEDGSNTWQPDGQCQHSYTIQKMRPAEVARRIERLMMEPPQTATTK